MTFYDGTAVHTHVYKLQTDNDVNDWNSIRHTMMHSSEFWQYGKAHIDKAGVGYAEVNASEQSKRIDPAVAMILVTTDNPGLKRMAGMTMEQLMSIIAAFVPYSVYKKEGMHDLVLPAGLQKTPRGYGYTKPLTPSCFKNHILQPTHLTIKGCLPRLMHAIGELHPKMCVFTRFALQDKYLSDPFGSSAMHTWSTIFKGRFKVDWVSAVGLDVDWRFTPEYKRRKEEHDASEAHFKLVCYEVDAAELKLLKLKRFAATRNLQEFEASNEITEEFVVEKRHKSKFPGTDTRWKEYNPGLGGPSYDGKTDMFTVVDNSGQTIVSCKNASTIASVGRLLHPSWDGANLGVPICGWTKM